MGLTCRHCHTPIIEAFYFCPHCGKKLKNPPVSTSIGRQLWIYFVSIAFPPLGLWPGFRYVFQKEKPRAKIIGIVAIVLTIVSTGVTLWYSVRMIEQLNSTISTQLQQYQTLDNYNRTLLK